MPAPRPSSRKQEPTPNEIKINLLRQRKYEAAHGDRSAFESQH